jgi:predicted RNA-binding protein Jag
VKYDPEEDTPEQLTERILFALFIKRIKHKKPTVAFIGGESGEGKSWSALRLMQILLKIQGIDIKYYLEETNVFTPLEYPKKLDNLLFKKELKKVNCICIQEARDVVKAKNWHIFLTQAIADVNAMSRSIKRLCFFVVSQFIRDITVDIRYTLNYYIIVRRPLGKKPQLFISVMWKDDRDLEKPKLRKRRIRGYIIDKKGRYRIYEPKYLELGRPDKEIIEMFDRRDFESKAKIIRKKIEKLIADMKVDMEVTNKKVTAMVEWYMKNQEQLNLIGKRVRGKWKVKPEVKVIHELNDMEAREFQDKLNESMKEKGMIEK